MKKLGLTIITFLLLTISTGYSGDVTMLQFFYTIKKVLPENNSVDILLPKGMESTEKAGIAKAAAKMGLKVYLHLITDGSSLRDALRSIKENTTVMPFDSPELETAIFRDMIIEYCNDKKLPVISSSKDYSDHGALLGLWKGTDGKIGLTVNLKESDHLAGKFNESFLQQIGAVEVIQ